MIQFKTKEAVTHIDAANIISGGTRQGVITLTLGGRVLTINMVNDDQGNLVEQVKVECAYQYTDDQGNVLPTSGGNVFVIDQGVKELSQSINASLPADDNIYDRFTNEVKVIAVQEFATQFGIETTDIEEIV